MSKYANDACKKKKNAKCAMEVFHTSLPFQINQYLWNVRWTSYLGRGDSLCPFLCAKSGFYTTLTKYVKLSKEILELFNASDINEARWNPQGWLPK